MFGIQLTGQCAEKGWWGSGSVINYRQISSYKDPSPPEHYFSWCAVNLINQWLSPHNLWPFQPASFYFMAWSFHFLHVLSVIQSLSPQKHWWMFDEKIKIPTHSSRFVKFNSNSPFSQLCSHFFRLSVFAFMDAQHSSAVIEEGAAEFHAPEPYVL